MSKVRILICCLVLALTGLAGAASAAKDDLDLVSRASGAAGAKGNDQSLSPAISADGRFVAFDSIATNLDPADSDNNEDVFVRDLQTNTTTLVSRASGATGDKGNNFSVTPSISADGRFIAFQSFASNLDPADGDTTADVFVRDRQTNTTTLVSRADGLNGAKGNDFSTDAAISADGRFVAFDSAGSNLQPVDGNSGGNTFVRDLQTNTTTLVSRAAGAAGVPGDGLSLFPAISGDGRFVAFYSFASNLNPGDGDTNPDVYRRDVLGPPAVQASRISVNNLSLPEGKSGQTAFRFTVSLDQAQPAPVTVDFSTANGTTIANDDQAATEPPSRISIANARRKEGNRGRTAFRFTVSLDRAQSAPVSISFSTANGTAKAPSDYSPARGTVTFARAETARTITVSVKGDKTKEANETFRVNLAAPTGNATIAHAHAAGTIVNDDRGRARRARMR